MQWVLVHGHLRKKPLFLRNTLWTETLSGTGIQLIQRCHIVMPKQALKNTTVSHTTSHVAKETSESKRRCVSSETSACDLFIDWHPWVHAPHAQTPATPAWNKQLETNSRNHMRRHATQRQIPPRKTAVGQLRFGNKIENPILRSTRATIMILLGVFVEHHADLLCKTWYKNWRLDTHRRCRCDKRSKIRSTTTDPPRPNTDALPWTHTPNHWQFSRCVK